MNKKNNTDFFVMQDVDTIPNENLVKNITR